MNESLKYTQKVWLTIIVLSPILANLALLCHAGNFHDFVGILKLFLGIPMVVILLGVITTPCAIVLYFCTRYFLTSDFNQVLAKLFLSIIGLLLTCATASIIGDFKFTVDYVIIILPYCIAVIVSIWLYKLQSHADKWEAKDVKQL